MEKLMPSRIGHGVAAAGSEEAVRKLAETKTVLEICPSSNLRTHAVASLAELGDALRTFEAAGVRYTINTDGPYLLNTHLRQEYELLLEAGILNAALVDKSIAVARHAAFIHSHSPGLKTHGIPLCAALPPAVTPACTPNPFPRIPPRPPVPTRSPADATLRPALIKGPTTFLAPPPDSASSLPFSIAPVWPHPRAAPPTWTPLLIVAGWIAFRWIIGAPAWRGAGTLNARG